MIRPLLLWASRNPFLSERLPRYGFARRAVRRFMPGERLEDALREAERLRDERGVGTIVTLLGENVGDEAGVRGVADHYREVLDEVGRRRLDTEISVKPTHLGLDLDPELARELIGGLCDRARAAAEPERGTEGSAGRSPVVWIDMEGSEYVDRTLSLYRSLREEHPNVGVCLQAYLRRTPDDLGSLLPLQPAIRLVKGAYAEPAEVAFPNKADVDRAYRELGRSLLEATARGEAFRPAFGTHDAALVGALGEEARRLGLPEAAHEVEMLYGIGTELQERLVAEGRQLRVLVSYGDAWFPWYMRRLAERPANLWFVVRSLWRR